eukprot:jgi/Ulvmu1/5979/UM026_0103.1
MPQGGGNIRTEGAAAWTYPGCAGGVDTEDVMLTTCGPTELPHWECLPWEFLYCHVTELVPDETVQNGTVVLPAAVEGAREAMARESFTEDLLEELLAQFCPGAHGSRP